MFGRSASLMETLAKEAGCTMLSDLCFLMPIEKQRQAQKIRFISSDAFSLREWNDALHYLAHEPSASSSQEARMRLIAYLNQSARKNPDIAG
ncbi:hypothetical protein ACTQ34_10575 [Agathobaculum sp. LCP25S3_E8]|uniref:hypothetical protein n=1 Tax=Agathobaculum sp. LCP25S3_E8 TaxID=3438735 RepID=UPI003F93E48F